MMNQAEMIARTPKPSDTDRLQMMEELSMGRPDMLRAFIDEYEQATELGKEFFAIRIQWLWNIMQSYRKPKKLLEREVGSMYLWTPEDDEQGEPAEEWTDDSGGGASTGHVGDADEC